MNAKELLKRLARGEPGPAYFFSGGEVHLKKKAIAAIVASIPEGQRDFNCDVFSGTERTLDEAVSAARTLPFLAPRRVVIFRDLEKCGTTPAKAGTLLAYLQDPSPSSSLVITTEDDTAARAWTKKTGNLWQAVDFRPLKGAALTGALGEAAGEKGISITREGVARLVEAVGTDLSRLNREIEKLALAVGPGGEAGAPEVDLHVCGYAYQTTFNLVQALCRRDLAGSLALLDAIELGMTELMGFLGMLSKRLRILWYLAGEEPGKVPGAFRVQNWQLGDLRREAAAFSRREIEGFLDDLLAIDRSVKTSTHTPDILMQRFVFRICPAPPVPAGR